MSMLRSVRGVLPMAIAARESGLKKLFVPVKNYGEANLVKGIEVYAFKTLFEVVNYLQGTLEYQPPVFNQSVRPPSAKDGLDFFDVRGQEVLIEYTVVAVAYRQIDPTLQFKVGSQLYLYTYFNLLFTGVQ